MAWAMLTARRRARRASDAPEAALDDRLRAALIESRDRYKQLVELAGDFAFETDAEGRFAFVSPRGALGYSVEELIGRRAAELLVDSGGDGRDAFAARRPIADAELWVRKRDGTTALLRIAAAPLKGGASFIGARGVARDITASHLQAETLARVDLRERALLRVLHAADGEVDPARALASVAAAIAAAFGCGCRILAAAGADMRLAAAARAAPDAFDALSRAPSEQPGEVLTRDGQALIAPARHRGRGVGALILWRPTGERRFDAEERDLAAAFAVHVGLLLAQAESQDALTKLARTDPLTGLLNRRAFIDEVERRLARVKAGDGHGALVLIDLDNFKPVNDRLGHAAGDEALIAIARHLAATVRGADLAARLGGDEFALWLEGADGRAAEGRAEALVVSVPVQFPKAERAGIRLGASAGIAAADAGTLSFATLARDADAALYAAKRAGKGRAALGAGA
ncbi:MAG: diguanylate cyclase [Gemmatimonas sp.]